MLDTQSQPNQPNQIREEISLKHFLTFFNYSKIKARPLFQELGTQTVGIVQTTIAHGLGRTPNIVIIQMTSAGNVYQSAAADKTNIYLTSDHYIGRTCNVEVAYIPDNLR